MAFCGIAINAISQEVFMNLICIMCLEIILVKLLAHLPGANALGRILDRLYIV